MGMEEARDWVVFVVVGVVLLAMMVGMKVEARREIGELQKLFQDKNKGGGDVK